MPALFSPQQTNFNHISFDNKPSVGVPFDPYSNNSGLENVDPKIIDTLFKNYRAHISKEIQDRDPIRLMQLADLYFMKRKYPEAEARYKKVLKINKNNLLAYQRVILCSMLQFPKNYQNVHLVTSGGLRDRVNDYYKNYLIASNRRIDILHEYVLFRLALFIDKKEDVSEESLTNLQEILKKEPNNYQVMDTIGFIYLNYKNNISEAEKWFNKVLKIESNYVYSINNLGVCFIREGSKKKAKKYFERAKRINDKFTLAYENLGIIEIYLKKYSKALVNLEYVLSNSGSISRNGYHNLALAYLYTGNLKKAQEFYENLIKMEPQNYLVMNNLGTTHVRLGNQKLAKKYYIDSIDNYEKYFKNSYPNIQEYTNTLHNLLRSAIETQDLDLIDKVVEKMEETNKKDSYIEYALAAKETLNKNYNLALKKFHRLFKKDPKIGDMYPMYSFILSAINNNYQSSVKILESARELGYGDVLIDNNLAYAYLCLNNIKKAEKIINKYKSGVPNILIPTIGMLELRKGNLEKGNYFYEHALSLAKSDVKDELGQIWLYEQALYWSKKGSHKKSLSILEAALSLKETYFTKNLSDLYKKLAST